jgi:hypothetical protein
MNLQFGNPSLPSPIHRSWIDYTIQIARVHNAIKTHNTALIFSNPGGPVFRVANRTAKVHLPFRSSHAIQINRMGPDAIVDLKLAQFYIIGERPIVNLPV